MNRAEDTIKNAIEIRGLTKTYTGFQLNHINLSLPKGSIMGLIGENGAGKSTTIRILMGAAKADSGEVKVLGQDINSADVKLKEDIGIVLDETGFPETLTAIQMNHMMKNVYKQWDEEEFFRLIKKFALPEKKGFSQLSKGMKMKLSLAVALSHKARLLVLDEATSGLDPVFRDQILDLFLDFTRNEENSILISSHILSDLEKICDYIAFIHKGTMLFCEEKDRLMESYGIYACRKSELKDLPADAVVGVRENSYGAEALVKRELMPKTLPVHGAGIEEIMLFMVKGEQR